MAPLVGAISVLQANSPLSSAPVVSIVVGVTHRVQSDAHGAQRTSTGIFDQSSGSSLTDYRAEKAAIHDRYGGRFEQGR
jgi:hypothetical protein